MKQINFLKKKKNKYFFFYKKKNINYLYNLYSENIKLLYSIYNYNYISFNNQVIVVFNFDNIMGLEVNLKNLVVGFNNFEAISNQNSDEFATCCILAPYNSLNVLFEKKDFVNTYNYNNEYYYNIRYDIKYDRIGEFETNWTNFLLDVHDFENCEMVFNFCEEIYFEIDVIEDFFSHYDNLYFYKKNQYFLPLNVIFNYKISYNFLKSDFFLESSILNKIYFYVLKSIFNINVNKNLLLNYLNFFSKENFTKLNILTLVLAHVDLFLKKRKTELVFNSISYGINLQSKRLSNIFYFKFLFWIKELFFNLMDIVEDEDAFRAYCSSKFLELNEKKYKHYISGNSKLLLKFKFKIKKIIEDFFRINLKMTDDTKYNNFDFIDHSSLDSYINFNLNKIFKEKIISLKSHNGLKKIDSLLFSESLLNFIPEKNQNTLFGFFISFLFNWFFLIKSDSFFQKEINIEWYRIVNFNLKVIVINIIVIFFKCSFNIINNDYMVMESRIDFILFKDLLDSFFRNLYCNDVLVFLQEVKIKKFEHYSSNFEFFIKNIYSDISVDDISVKKDNKFYDNISGDPLKYNYNVENYVYSRLDDIKYGVDFNNNNIHSDDVYFDNDFNDSIGVYKYNKFSNDYLLDTSVVDENSRINDNCMVDTKLTFVDDNFYNNVVCKDRSVGKNDLYEIDNQLVEYTGSLKFNNLFGSLFFVNKSIDIKKIINDTIDVKFFLNKKYLNFFKRTSLSLFLLKWENSEIFMIEINLKHKLDSLNPVDGGLLLDLFSFLDLYNVSYTRAFKNIVEFNIFCGFSQFDFLIDGKFDLFEDYLKDSFKISSFLFQEEFKYNEVLDYEYFNNQNCCFFYDLIIFEESGDLVVYNSFKFNNFNFDDDFSNFNENFFDSNKSLNGVELNFFEKFDFFFNLYDFPFTFWLEEEFVFDLMVSEFMMENFETDDVNYDCSCCVVGCIFCDEKRSIELEDWTFDYLNYTIPNMYKRLSFQKKNVLIEGLNKTFNVRLVKYIKHLYFGCDLEDDFTNNIINLLYQSLNNPDFLFKIFFFLNELKEFKKVNYNNKLYFLLNFAEKLTINSRFGDLNYRFYRFNFKLFKFTKKIKEFLSFFKKKNKKLFLIKRKDLINKIHRYLVFDNLRQKRINKNLITNLFWLKRISFRLKNLEEIKNWNPVLTKELNLKNNYLSFSKDEFKKYNKRLLGNNKKIIKFIEDKKLLLDRQSRLDFFKRSEKIEFKDRTYEEAFNNILHLQSSNDFFKLSSDFTYYFEKKKKTPLSRKNKKIVTNSRLSDSSLPVSINLNFNSLFERFNKYDYSYNLNITPVDFGHYNWSSIRPDNIFLYWSDKCFLEKIQINLKKDLILLNNKFYFLSFLEDLNKIKDFFFLKIKTISSVILNSFYFKQTVSNLFFDYKADIQNEEVFLSSFFYDFLFKKSVFKFKFFKKKIENNSLISVKWKLIRLFNKKNRIFFKKNKLNMSLNNFYLDTEFGKKIYYYYNNFEVISSINDTNCIDVMNNFFIINVSFYKEYSYNIFVFWNLFNFISFLSESDFFELFCCIERLLLSNLKLRAVGLKKNCFFSIFLMVNSVEAEFLSMFDLNLFFDKEININNNVSLFFLYYSVLNNNYICRDFFFKENWQDQNLNLRRKEIYIFDKIESCFF